MPVELRILYIVTAMLFVINGSVCASFLPAIAKVEIDRVRAASGQSIQASFTFYSTGPASRQLDMFIHIVPESQDNCIGAGFTPEIPTNMWPKDKFIKETPLPIVIPHYAKPGKYEMLIGLYDTLTGERWPLDNPNESRGDRRYFIGEIEVVAADVKVDAAPVSLDFRPVDSEKVISAAQMESTGLLSRREPDTPVILRNDKIEVVLDGRDGVPYSYRTISNNGYLHGESAGAKPVASLFQRNPRGFASCEVIQLSRDVSKSCAKFNFEARYNDVPAARFTLNYSLENSTISISLDDIQEFEGYELIEVYLPELVSESSGIDGLWIAYPENGGRLVDVKEARKGTARWITNWWYPAPIAVLGTRQALAMIEVPAYMDTTEVAIRGDTQSRRRTSLGTTKAVRIPGGEATPNIRVEQNSLCNIHLLGDSDGDGSVDWLDGAKFLAARMPDVPNDYYDDKFVYKIDCDQWDMDKPHCTFEQAADLIRRFAAVTDDWPQVAYLFGWQYQGTETGWPAVDVVSSRLGGYDALMRLKSEAQALNCIVSLHDNYDDAYMDSPGWNPAFIARDADGNLMKGGVWLGRQSYIIGLAKYASSHGLERVRYTCERYKLEDTYHIDVMSAAPLRNDWNPENPASGVSNLKGKWAIIDAFAARGVDLTSEGLSWPFIGKMSYFWNMIRDGSNRFGNGISIPLAAAVYRKSARWGGVNSDGFGILESLFHNCAYSCHANLYPDRMKLQVDSFYLLQVPWFKLHSLPIRTYQRDGEKVIIGFGNNSFATLDWGTGAYSVMVDGVEIARDYSVFCQLDSDRVAFYARDSRELGAKLPNEWNENDIVAFALYEDGQRKEVAAAVRDGFIYIAVSPRTPVIAYRNRSVAHRIKQK